MKFTIADKITIFRLWLFPLAVALYYIGKNWSYFLCSGIIILIALSDFMDGYLARKMNQESEFGAFLDPVADKVCVVGMLIILASHFTLHHIYVGIFVTISTLLIALREIVISALREFMAMRNLRDKVGVKTIGKWKTFAQCVAIILLTMTSGHFSPEWLFDSFFIAGMVSLGVAVVLTFLSFVAYFQVARRHLLS
jgi:CDP-diacylglycerol---glycerol-3-phosphate 3-phosphatidyltransferase